MLAFFGGIFAFALPGDGFGLGIGIPLRGFGGGGKKASCLFSWKQLLFYVFTFFLPFACHLNRLFLGSGILLYLDLWERGEREEETEHLTCSFFPSTFYQYVLSSLSPLPYHLTIQTFSITFLPVLAPGQGKGDFASCLPAYHHPWLPPATCLPYTFSSMRHFCISLPLGSFLEFCFGA